MPDDLRKTGKPDDTRINLDQPFELAYWAKRLGVSRIDLRHAVRAAGPTVRKVQAWLAPMQPPSKAMTLAPPKRKPASRTRRKDR